MYSLCPWYVVREYDEDKLISKILLLFAAFFPHWLSSCFHLFSPFPIYYFIVIFINLISYEGKKPLEIDHLFPRSIFIYYMNIFWMNTGSLALLWRIKHTSFNIRHFLKFSGFA